MKQPLSTLTRTSARVTGQFHAALDRRGREEEAQWSSELAVWLGDSHVRGGLGKEAARGGQETEAGRGLKGEQPLAWEG